MKKTFVTAVLVALMSGLVLVACSTCQNPEETVAQQADEDTGKTLVCGHEPQNLSVYFDDSTDTGEAVFTDKSTNETWTGSFEKTENGFIIHCNK
ncbi:MAG: hypothetical protein J5701_05435 [Bacteroidales bacterium]|nr:hypothetical protein [Bacteroidales bacterium]